MSSVIASIVLACPFAHGAPQAKVPDAALFDELIRKTNELRAFVAVYRVHAPGATEENGGPTLRITFLAPDEMKLEFPGHLLTCVRMGIMEFRGESQDGKSMTAHVVLSESTMKRYHRFANLVCSELSASTSDWPTETDCGPELQMKFSPSEKVDEENFQFMVSYACSRTSVLGWLEAWKVRTDARIENGDHIVFTTPKGCVVTLSTRTGFVESIRKRKSEGVISFELESLDLDPNLKAASFDLPAPAADAVDSSEQFSRQWHNAITQSQRWKLFKWISGHVSDGKMEWNADARVHVRKVLEVLHSDGITLENEVWIASTKKWTETYGASLRERYASLAQSDAVARDELEATIREERDKLFERLQEGLRVRLSSFSIDAAVVPDAALRSSLGDVDSAAMQTAYEHALQDPLLESFDDQVQRAKSGG